MLAGLWTSSVVRQEEAVPRLHAEGAKRPTCPERCALCLHCPRKALQLEPIKFVCPHFSCLQDARLQGAPVSNVYKSLIPFFSTLP